MKTIFITGASTGLGKATAKLFASKGWKVIATMRKPENETVLNLLDNVILLPLDVTNPAQIKETTQKAIALGNIDVVFNNAAYGLGGPLESYSDAQIEPVAEQTYRTNINDVALRVRLLSPLGAASKVEKNVVMGPGRPGSVDKGSLEPRGERLLVSTAGRVTSVHFVWELSF